MGWNTITCPDCHTRFDTDKALQALEREIWDKEARFGGMPTFRRPTVMGTLDAVQCPKCKLRLRGPVWPFGAFMVSALPLWFLVFAGSFGVDAGHFQWSDISIFLWGSGLLAGVGFCVMAIGVFVAKPVKCGRFD
jgi:hypothetical protein